MSAITFWMYFVLYTPLPCWSVMIFIGHGLLSTLRAIKKFQHGVSNIGHDDDSDLFEFLRYEVKPGEKKSIRTDFLHMLKTGDNVVNFLKSINSSFGSLIFDECAMSLFVMITGGYTGLSTLSLIMGREQGPSPFLLCYCSQGMMVFALSFYRLFYSVTMGEDIQRDIARTVDMLRQQLLRHHDELDEQMRFRCAMLQEKFERFHCIRPRKMFRLNRAMVLGSASTLATYLVIMMQFRAGDISNDRHGDDHEVDCGNLTTVDA